VSGATSFAHRFSHRADLPPAASRESKRGGRQTSTESRPPLPSPARPGTSSANEQKCGGPAAGLAGCAALPVAALGAGPSLFDWDRSEQMGERNLCHVQ